jgi:ABC-type Fe3+ transport system substrate-binding protein
MNARRLSRREMLRMVGVAGGASLMAACAPSVAQPIAAPAPTAAPKTAANIPNLDFKKSGDVGFALQSEGAEVSITSWGFSGLPETHFIPKFAAYTQKKYGVAVKLNWLQGIYDTALRELPAAGKTAADIGLDVVDKEEDSFAAAMAVNFYEPIDMDQYKPLLSNLDKIEEVYRFRGEKVNGGDIYGAVYQGYEWLQGLLRQDKVDVKKYNDWWDLTNPELKDKIITYPMNDQRGHFIFAGFVNSLVKSGQAAKLWDQASWQTALQMWKDKGMEGQIHKWGDLGNDQTMRVMIQSGEAWAGGLWGTYTRGLMASDWNKRDNVIASFIPVGGCVADRETCSATRGAKHPVAARILIDWMMSTEFNTAGWYKEKPEDADATNHWNITEALFLTAYCGGVYPEMRQAIPNWAQNMFIKNPADFTITCDWPWYRQNAEWISKTYEKVVLGKG